MNDKATSHETPNDVEKFDGRGAGQAQSKEIITTADTLLQIAVRQGADLEKLKKLMDLKERNDQYEAKKLYVTAISEFKKKPLEILKDKKVSFKTSKGKTEYDHATLANVVNVISSELGKQGLSAAWKTNQEGSEIKVTCILTHCGGHSEEVTLIAPPDDSGNKPPIQALASTVSYLERYTLLAITGLATKDMDTDGIPPEEDIEYITVDMQTEIADFIKATKTKKADFLKYIKVDAIEKIPMTEYGKVIAAFQAKEDAQIKKDAQKKAESEMKE